MSSTSKPARPAAPLPQHGEGAVHIAGLLTAVRHRPLFGPVFGLLEDRMERQVQGIGQSPREVGDQVGMSPRRDARHPGRRRLWRRIPDELHAGATRSSENRWSRCFPSRTNAPQPASPSTQRTLPGRAGAALLILPLTAIRGSPPIGHCFLGSSVRFGAGGSHGFPARGRVGGRRQRGKSGGRKSAGSPSSDWMRNSM